ncbi:MAG: O-antigen ligase family protein [Planctomycetota bacterium]
MSTLAVQRFPVAIVAVITAMTLGGFALVLSASVESEALLIYWIALGGLVAFVWYSARGDLLTAVLFWFVTLIALHEEFWRMPMPLFFTLTIPRVGIIVLVLLFGAMLVLGRVRLRHAWPMSGVILAVAAYFFLSAVISGFETRSVVSVHYRLIGGYLFPFTILGLIVHAFRAEGDFRRMAVFFALLSAYLTFTGWCERFGVTSLIVPGFIADPHVGIHWGRVRGPFVMSAAMGLALVYCFFNNLVLARNAGRFGWMLHAINGLMLPVLFWTKTRSVWLSFVLCSLIWTVYSRRHTTRVVSVCVLLSVAMLIGVVNMDNFLSSDRAKGGLTDMEPLLLRIGLAQMTWEILNEHPLVGVGFGHFRDYAPAYARDPSSPFYAFGSSALEHNNLLSIVAETGLLGLALYLAMIVFLLRYSIRLYRKLSTSGTGFINRDLLVLYWILTMAYFIDGTFRETSDNPFANSLFFGLSAVPIALDILLSPSPIRARAGFPRPGSGGLRLSPPGSSIVPGRSTAPPRLADSAARRSSGTAAPRGRRSGESPPPGDRR